MVRELALNPIISQYVSKDSIALYIDHNLKDMSGLNDCKQRLKVNKFIIYCCFLWISTKLWYPKRLLNRLLALVSQLKIHWGIVIWVSAYS